MVELKLAMLSQEWQMLTPRHLLAGASNIVITVVILHAFPA
jgi:hypothetical protein